VPGGFLIRLVHVHMIGHRPRDLYAAQADRRRAITTSRARAAGGAVHALADLSEQNMRKAGLCADALSVQVIPAQGAVSQPRRRGKSAHAQERVRVRATQAQFDADRRGLVTHG
jgi:hypothetical protein